MTVFWKITGMVLLSLILSIAVDKHERDIGLVLSILVCCTAAIAAVSCLEPVLDFLWELQSLCSFPDGLFAGLVKAVGIALVAELSATVCNDAGKAALGKMLHFLGSAAVLTLSIPLFQELMKLIKEMVRQL